jgi:hypothetical protein
MGEVKLFIICFDFRWPSLIRQEQDFITKLFMLSGNFSYIFSTKKVGSQFGKGQPDVCC